MSVKPVFHIDIILLIIGVLLAVTLIAFFTERIPYPYGFFVLAILLVARILHLRNKK
jgi:MFS-type transporter involved in bile tolerance (Atg22 family)